MSLVTRPVNILFHLCVNLIHLEMDSGIVTGTSTRNGAQKSLDNSYALRKRKPLTSNYNYYFYHGV